jgi:hypothetical protein
MARIGLFLEPPLAALCVILVRMYRHLAVFEMDGTFVGYVVKEANNRTLQSTHLYSEEEGEDLAKRIAELNESQNVLAAWPDARDPDVQCLVDDPAFEPIEMANEEVVDEENSYIVYLKDADGEDTFEIDRDASVLKYKVIAVPVRSSDVMKRTKTACEVVARRRAA